MAVLVWKSVNLNSRKYLIFGLPKGTVDYTNFLLLALPFSCTVEKQIQIRQTLSEWLMCQPHPYCYPICNAQRKVLLSFLFHRWKKQVLSLSLGETWFQAWLHILPQAPGAESGGEWTLSSSLPLLLLRDSIRNPSEGGISSHVSSRSSSPMFEPLCMFWVRKPGLSF